MAGGEDDKSMKDDISTDASGGRSVKASIVASRTATTICLKPNTAKDLGFCPIQADCYFG
jgi:hypothetical protein